MGVQNLDEPESSSMDKKEYRNIKLDNGLTALLIADTRVHLDQIEAEERGLSDKKNLKKSAAGLCVRMGSFSDLSKLPGIAHFLEHMVFMGSEKYQDESDFGFFISNHGGSYNASTDAEATIFQFDVQRQHFEKGLDRLAQFFTSPLLKKDAMTREREAVDSEFLMAIQNDYYAQKNLLGSLSKDGHPMGNFGWGNIESLTPKDLDDDAIHKLLVEFKNRHYSSHYMTLVVQSQDTLDNLQRMVVDLFSSVPNNGKECEKFDHKLNPFDTDAFKKIYKVVPIESTYRLDMSWALPPLKQKYRTKPLKYLSTLIGHEGEGSLISYLRDKVLALDLDAGNSGYGFDMNSTCSIFNISIELTYLGFTEYESVINAVYMYILMLVKNGPVERIYGEIKRMQQIDFDFGDESQPLENVETLCEKMLFLPPDRYLDGDTLLFDFNVDLIRECLDHICNSNYVNIILSAKEFEDSANKTTPWFKTKYSVEDISNELLSKWKSSGSFESNFHLPKENEFIPQNLELLSKGDLCSVYPTRIHLSESGELFYKKDNTFQLPRACAYFHFCSNIFMESKPENSVCLDLMIDIINQQMKTDTYPASIAKLTFDLTSCAKGMILKVQGFSDKLDRLLNVIISHIKNFESLISNETFNAIKEQTKKNYFNSFTKASKLVCDLRLTLLQDFYHGAQIKHSFINSIDLEKLKSFGRSFKSGLFIQCLVQGNVSPSDAEKYFNLAKAISDKDLTASPQEICCKEIPVGQMKIRMKGILPEDNNTFVNNYYQSGMGDIYSYAMLNLLNMVLNEPVFDILRTKEQLGYYVFSLVRNIHGVLGIEVTVNSQENKFLVDFVEKRIDTFLKDFYEKEVLEMKESKFQEYLEALIKKKTISDVTLEEEVNRNWNEIMTKDYVFDRNLQEATLYQNRRITLTDLQQNFKNTFICPDAVRKLSFQVVGTNKTQTEDSSHKEKLPLDKKYPMELEVPPNVELFVSDLNSFKESLSTFPTNHINK